MSESVKVVIEKLNAMFVVADQVLTEWDYNSGNLQFSTLLSIMSSKLNWSDKDKTESDAVVRYYIRNNPNYYVTRGAHGGIMSADVKGKKDQAKQVKEQLKSQMKSMIESKVSESESE